MENIDLDTGIVIVLVLIRFINIIVFLQMLSRLWTTSSWKVLEKSTLPSIRY